MTEKELGARTAIMMQVMASCGVTDEGRIEAMVGLTIGIPWYKPPRRKDPGHKGGLLFPLAAKEAANRCSFGPVKPADIFEAALSIDGYATTVQGHRAEVRWVRLARESMDGLKLTEADMLQIPGPGREAAVRQAAIESGVSWTILPPLPEGADD